MVCNNTNRHICLIVLAVFNTSHTTYMLSLIHIYIAETRKFSVKTPEIVVNVNPDRADLVDIQVIDGRKCLVIPIDEEVEVNGIAVNAK